MNWWTVAAALIGGGLVQLIANLVNYLIKKREITVTDDASVRDSLQMQASDLMDERKGLVAEIDKLAQRCGDIEKENRELSRQNREMNEQMLNFKQEAFEKERAMQEEIDRLKREVEALKSVREEETGSGT